MRKSLMAHTNPTAESRHPQVLSSTNNLQAQTNSQATMSSTGCKTLVVRFLLFGLLHFRTAAQVIGEDICACSPSVYRFTLDFTADPSTVCPPTNITLGGGVASAECLIRPFSNPAVTDLVPVSVTRIDIFEYGQDVTLLVEEGIDGTFLQGDFFDYESFTFNPEDITSTMDIPKVFQLTLRGPNADGEELVNISVITLTNVCDAYPVFDFGESSGWAVFDRLTSPDESLCPIAAGTSSPVMSPPGTPSPVTPGPTTAPPTTDAPTPAPTRRPSLRPVNPPSPTLAPANDMQMSMNLRGLQDFDEALDNEFGRDI